MDPLTMLIQIDAEEDINKMTGGCQRDELAAARLMMTVPIGDDAQLEKKLTWGYGAGERHAVSYAIPHRSGDTHSRPQP